MSYSVTIRNNCPDDIHYRVYREGGDFIEGVANANSVGEKTSSPTQLLKLHGNTTRDNTSPQMVDYLEPDFDTHQVKITPVFGPRTAKSIKVYMACMAGPADPDVRNDITLINAFREAGVPQENIWMFLERQCTPNTITSTLPDAISTCHPGDIMFIYLGGHGGGGEEYRLCTYNGKTTGPMICKAIEKCCCPIFLVIDSCYSGQMIVDAKKYFANATEKPHLSILTSVQHDLPACTGWALIQMLLDHVSSGKYVSPTQISNYVVNNLRTGSVKQRAQYYTDSKDENTLATLDSPVNLTVDQQVITVGEKMLVRWKAYEKSSALEGSWIGLYPKGASNRDFIHFFYTEDLLQGYKWVSVKMDAHFGPAEFRYFSGKSSYESKGSASFIVNDMPDRPKVTLSMASTTLKLGSYATVSWSAGDYINARGGAWIGVFASDAGPKDYEKFVYTSDALDGNLNILFDKAGTFYVRYMSHQKSYDALATITVTVD